MWLSFEAIAAVTGKYNEELEKLQFLLKYMRIMSVEMQLI